MIADKMDSPIKRPNITTNETAHSQSILSGLESTYSFKYNFGKKLAVRVQMLDGSISMFQVQAKAVGKILFDQVCRQLHLLEADYFGLEYEEQSTNSKYWLDLRKPLNRQTGLLLTEPLLRFCVKFYTPNPAQLEEEYTRYLFCLQIKRDLATGSFQCNNNSAALMASYIVQASCGDFVPEDYPDHTYLTSHRFVPHQDTVMQTKIMENHKKHSGQSPAEADMNLLETARRCEHYGMKMHAAKDIEGVTLSLSVAHMGIAVFQGITRINIFSWAKIRKISFKRKRFLIKLHAESSGYYKDTVEFSFDRRNDCKSFWKKCVETHGFFRCVSVENHNQRKASVLSRGSQFRYSGKTQKQIIEFVRENYVKRQHFERSLSFRQGPLNESIRSQSQPYVNSSYSAGCLPPIGIDRDKRDPCNTSILHISTRSMDTWNHPKYFSEKRLSQVTAASVEMYQKESCVQQLPHVEGDLHSTQNISQLSVQKGSPSLPDLQLNKPQIYKKFKKTENQVQRQVLLSSANLGQNQSSPLEQNSNSLAISIKSQAGVKEILERSQEKMNTNDFKQRRVNLVTHNKLLKTESKESISLKIAKSMDLTTQTTSQENIVSVLNFSPQSTPVHYSSINFSTSKKSSLQNNSSLNTKINTVNNSSINNASHNELSKLNANDEEYKKSNKNLFDLTTKCDLYAKIDRKSKKVHHLSYEFLDKSPKKEKNSSAQSFTTTLPNYLSNLCKVDNRFLRQNKKSSSTLSSTKFDPSDLNENSDACQYNDMNLFNDNTDQQFYSCRNDSLISTKSELSLICSMESSKTSCNAVGTQEIPEQNNNVNISKSSYKAKFYKNIDVTELNINETKSKSETEEFSNLCMCPDSSIEDNFYKKKESWMKSSSCRDLLSEKENPHRMLMSNKELISFNMIDTAVTLSNESCQSIYFGVNQAINYGNFIRSSKIFSSSFPGSIRNNFWDCKLKQRNCINYSGSQEELTHDSYELSERKYEILNKNISFSSSDGIRSSSFDSGNFVLSDDEILAVNHKYHSDMDVPSKTAADVMYDIWGREDPRYLPREKMSVKSDGNFYRKILESQGSQNFNSGSLSDNSETKFSGSSCFSKKSRDSLYHTDSKKSCNSTKSRMSLVSSSASKESLTHDFFYRKYEMPMTTGDEPKLTKNNKELQRKCSLGCKSDNSNDEEFSKNDIFSELKKGNSFGCLCTQPNSFNARVSGNASVHNSNEGSSSISVKHQNMDTKNIAHFTETNSSRNNCFDICKEGKQVKPSIPSGENSYQHIGNEYHQSSVFKKKTDSENIFSFECDKIDSLTFSLESSEERQTDEIIKENPQFPLSPELLSEFDKQTQSFRTITTRKEELIAKTHFEEYNPKECVLNNEGLPLPNLLGSLSHKHGTVERTKSDPNSLAKRSRFCKNQRRNVLVHQKSIDLTPLDSSDEDYLYKKIPSAPPQCKTFGNFEMLQCYDTPITQNDETKTDFEIQKRITNEIEHETKEVFKGEFKDDIPYILHKRLVSGNGNNHVKQNSPKSVISSRTPNTSHEDIKYGCENMPMKESEDFLLAQNIDVVDYGMPAISESEKLKKKFELIHPNRRTSKKNDRKVKVSPNKNLNWVEEDFENTQEDKICKNRFFEVRRSEKTLPSEEKIITSHKGFATKKFFSKTRAITKIQNIKTRITSFSSDDESLDSDDVFGSTELMPLALEFSPPQSRKEIEPILKIEQNKLLSATLCKGQTMSSTEIEGSPPQCRRLAELENRYFSLRNDSVYHAESELRRISERSISISSSEEGSLIAYESICVGVLSQPDSAVINLKNAKIKTRSIEPFSVENSKPRASNKSQDKQKYKRDYLNLSEGSGLAFLGKEKPSFEECIKERRTQSLEISLMHTLALNDKLADPHDSKRFEEQTLQKELNLTQNLDDFTPDKNCSITSTEIFPNSIRKDTILRTVFIDSEEINLLNKLAFIEKIALKGVKVKDRKKSTMELKDGNHLILDILKYNFDCSPLSSCNSSIKTTPGVSRANSLEGVKQNKLNTRAKNSESTKIKQNIGPILKAKKGKKHSNDSIRLFESKKRLSKERDETHDESLADIAKRKERQQKLYESAVKQTITMLSPMPENSISANTEVDNISLQNTVDSRASNLVLIADSLPNLDTSSLVKYSRSFDEGNQQQKLQKANRSFEDRNKSYEDSEKSDTASDAPVESSDRSIKCQTFEEIHAYEKGSGCLKNKHISAARNKLEADKIYGKKNPCAENRVIPEQMPFNVCDMDIYKIFALQNNSNDGIDTQAVISERRLLEILKRQSHRFECMTGDSTESYVSIDDSTSESKSSIPVKDFQNRVTTSESLEPTINEDISYQRNSNAIKESDLVRTSMTSLDHTLIKKPLGSEATESIPIVERESLLTKSVIDDLPTFQPSIELLIINAFEKTSVDHGYRKDELEKKHFPQDNNSMTICAGPSSNKLSNAVEFEKEGTSVDEESSISCSIAGPLGISYNNEDLEDQKWLDLKRTLEECLEKKTIAAKPTDRERSLTKKFVMPVLEKQASIDFGRTELKNYHKEETPTENVLEPKNEENKFQNSDLYYQDFLEKTSRDTKPPFESQGSNGTESNSSSFEIAICQGEIPEPTWTSFTTQIPENLPSEGSFVVVDNESSDVAPALRNSDSKGMNLTSKKNKSVDDPSDFTIPLSNPLSRNTLYGIESDSVDNLGYNAVFPTGRTLSRISERSTASEKSSIEDDVSKLSTHSLSMQDESAASIDQQLSMSSSSHSNSNIAYLSDADRRTSAEMPEIPCDSSITGERLPNASFHHAKSMTIMTGRFAVTQVKEDISEECNRTKLSLTSNNGSQDSEDWPLPEIPYDFTKSTELLNLHPNIEKLSRNILCWNPSASLQSQVTKNLFSSPLYKEDVLVEENAVANVSLEHETMKFDVNKVPSDKTLCMGYKHEIHDFKNNDLSCKYKTSLTTSVQDSSLVENNRMITTDCLGSLPFLPYSDGCCLSYKQDNIKPEKNKTCSDSVIVFQPTRVGQNTAFVPSEEILSESENIVISSVENRNKLSSHKITNEYVNSDTQKQSEFLHDDPKSLHLPPYRKYSHSSHSEEETSSFASDIDETVRFGLQFNKCTHSSHSEDTSMCLSISEWSTGTTTIHQYANLSGSDSISAVSNHSLGIKSEKSNNTKSSVSSFNKSSESLNAKSSKFVLQSSFDGVQYDKLSNSDTDKHSDSVTRSDETDTLSGAQSYNQFPSNKTQVEEDNNCLSLKTNQNVDTVKNVKDTEWLLALVHKNTNNPNSNSEEICTARREYDAISKQNEITYDGVVNKSTSVETTERWFQNPCNQPDSELFNEYLYRNNKIFPLQKPPTKPQHYSSSNNKQNEDNRLSFNSQSPSSTSTKHSQNSTTGL